MAQVILPSRWREQPRHSVRIDWAHPSTVGLNGAMCGSDPFRELVWGAKLLSSRATGIYPRGYRGNLGTYRNATASGVSYITPVAAQQARYQPASGDMTIAAFGVQYDTEQNNTFFFNRGNGSPNSAWAIGVNGGSTDGIVANWNFNGGASAGGFTATALQFPVLFRPRFVSLVFDPTNITGYCDRVPGKAQTTRPAGDWYYEFDSTLARTVAFGSVLNSGFRITTFASFQWLRALPEAELRALSDAPYQMFKRDVARSYFFPPSRPEKAPAVIVPDKWKRQPTRPMRLNAKEQLTRGITFLWTAANLRQSTVPSVWANYRYSDVLALTSIDGAGISIARTNQAIRFQGNELQGPVSPGTGAFTVAVYSKPETGRTDVRVDFDYYNSSTYQWRMQPNYNGSASAADAYAFLTYDGTGFTNAGANSVIDGRPTVWMGRRIGTDHQLFKNGRSVAQTTNTARNVSIASQLKISIGYWGGNSGVAYGAQYLTAYWNRALADAEARAFAENPWQLFVIDPARTYFYPRPMQPRRVWTMTPGRADRRPL